jgi:hypothetical protein
MQVQDMSKFAYVTLLMKGDFYVPGALVLASSLKRTGNRADVICMVTEDVSPTVCWFSVTVRCLITYSK